MVERAWREIDRRHMPTPRSISFIYVEKEMNTKVAGDDSGFKQVAYVQVKCAFFEPRTLSPAQ